VLSPVQGGKRRAQLCSIQRRTSGGADLTCSMENVKLVMLEYPLVMAFNRCFYAWQSDVLIDAHQLVILWKRHIRTKRDGRFGCRMQRSRFRRIYHQEVAWASAHLLHSLTALTQINTSIGS
jgi:hypothetical protein